jgi:hypothetical protein
MRSGVIPIRQEALRGRSTSVVTRTTSAAITSMPITHQVPAAPGVPRCAAERRTSAPIPAAPSSVHRPALAQRMPGGDDGRSVDASATGAVTGYRLPRRGPAPTGAARRRACPHAWQKLAHSSGLIVPHCSHRAAGIDLFTRPPPLHRCAIAIRREPGKRGNPAGPAVRIRPGTSIQDARRARLPPNLVIASGIARHFGGA